MERLKQMKEMLMSVVQGQMTNLNQVDTKELGEAVDMIKDLSEAIYYCSITKAMEKQEKDQEEMLRMMKLESKEGKEHHHYYTPMVQPMYYPPTYNMNYFHEGMRDPYYQQQRDMDRGMGRMYYAGGNSSGNSSNGNGSSNGGNSSGGNNARGGGTRGYSEYELPFDMMNMRDHREGRAPMTRKMYMESKEMHKDKESKMRDLEKYMQDLSQDVVEMIEDASKEEKQMLEKKITSLASKISQLNG